MYRTDNCNISNTFQSWVMFHIILFFPIIGYVMWRYCEYYLYLHNTLYRLCLLCEYKTVDIGKENGRRKKCVIWFINISSLNGKQHQRKTKTKDDLNRRNDLNGRWPERKMSSTIDDHTDSDINPIFSPYDSTCRSRTLQYQKYFFSNDFLSE